MKFYENLTNATSSTALSVYLPDASPMRWACRKGALPPPSSFEHSRIDRATCKLVTDRMIAFLLLFVAFPSCLLAISIIKNIHFYDCRLFSDVK